MLLKLVTDTFRTSGASGKLPRGFVRQVLYVCQGSDLKTAWMAKLVDGVMRECGSADLRLATMQRSGAIWTVLRPGQSVWPCWRICLSFGGQRAVTRKVKPLRGRPSLQSSLDPAHGGRRISWHQAVEFSIGRGGLGSRRWITYAQPRAQGPHS